LFPTTLFMLNHCLLHFFLQCLKLEIDLFHFWTFCFNRFSSWWLIILLCCLFPLGFTRRLNLYEIIIIAMKLWYQRLKIHKIIILIIRTVFKVIILIGMTIRWWSLWNWQACLIFDFKLWHYYSDCFVSTSFSSICRLLPCWKLITYIRPSYTRIVSKWYEIAFAIRRC